MVCARMTSSRLNRIIANILSASVGDRVFVSQPRGGFGEEVGEAFQYPGGVVAVHSQERALRQIERVPVPAVADVLRPSGYLARRFRPECEAGGPPEL